MPGRKGLLLVVAGLLILGGCGGSEGEVRLADAEDCPAFPKDNHWNQPVDKLPVHTRSDAIVESIGADEPTHPDFASGQYEGAPIGIPYVTVGGDTKRVPVKFGVAEESDPGPYPIPTNAPIEGGPKGDGDRHVIAVDRDECKVYELFSAFPEGGGWRAESGAVWDLTSNAQRKRGYTSADAAGLPILPGLARPDEVNKGKIDHALRITVPTSRQAFVYPASHFASEDTDPNQPSMGERLRLKSSFDISGFPRQSKVVLQALKTYGAIVADNGSPWFISGIPSKDWNNDDLNAIKRVPGSEWEVVDSTKLSRPEP